MQQQSLDSKEDPQNVIKKCTFFNLKKKRMCNIHVYKEDYDFCIFHLPEKVDNVELVDCPVDSTHQVMSHKLQKHVKFCNKARLKSELETNPFFAEGINNDKQGQETKATRRLQELFQTRSPVFQSLVEQIPQFFRRACELYLEHCLKNTQGLQKVIDYLLDDVPRQTIDHSANEKDLEQVKLLVQSTENFNLLSEKYSYIEYGAGKGRLSHELALRIKEKTQANSCHVLIEREPRRLKFDRHHRDNPYYFRVRMDITDFNLAQLVKQLPESYFTHCNTQLEYVGVCKHMCGAGTDLTIQSLLKSQADNRKFTGLLCATCCHHLCDEQTYAVKL